ncbi:MAG: STAS domain-containing protein, partial [Gemmobacter sp.]
IVLVTFLLVVFRDLTEGIIAGAAIGGAVFIRRMSEAARLDPHGGTEAPYDPSDQGGDVVVYRLRGAWFFGAAATLGSVLDRIADRPRVFVVDMTEVPFIDTSGARSFEVLARKTERGGGRLVLTGANPEVRRMMLGQGVREPLVAWRATVDDALSEFRRPA